MSLADVRRGEVEPIVEVACAEDPFAVPTAEVLSRHGISTFGSSR